MQDWILVFSVLLVLGGVAVWTVRVQRSHDSLAVLMSAVAVFFAVIPLGPFVVVLIARTWFFHGATIRLPHIIGASASALSLTAGPFLLALAMWMRRDESLPFSTAILQVLHAALWAILTLLGIGLAIGLAIDV